MRTIIRSLLSFALLMALSGMANAGGPPTILVGSWGCDLQGETVFLASFNLEGTFTASGNTGDTSVNYGVWERTGLDTFISTDLAFIFEGGIIQKTNASIEMSDNDNLTADLVIVINGGDPIEIEITCKRIQVDTD